MFMFSSLYVPVNLYLFCLLRPVLVLFDFWLQLGWRVRCLCMVSRRLETRALIYCACGTCQGRVHRSAEPLVTSSLTSNVFKVCALILRRHACPSAHVHVLFLVCPRQSPFVLPAPACLVFVRFFVAARMAREMFVHGVERPGTCALIYCARVKDGCIDLLRRI